VRKRWLRTFAALVFAVLCTAAALSVTAQQQGSTTRYVYDESGRLHAVISPTGEAVVYEYDAAGNITSVQRLAADALALFGFSPHEGLPGDQVTFVGIGFSGGVSNVSFNGVSATIVSVSPSVVVAQVPEGATTGPVTITTPRGSVTTSTPFTIVGLRVSPTNARVDFGQTAQFSAQVLPLTLDQSVVWSVNGIDGGNSAVGTISASGIYTAPNSQVLAVTIRATSVTEPLRYGEAQVTVHDPSDVQSVFAAAVSVSRGDNVGTAALAPQVAVQYGVSADSQTSLAKPVAVQYGTSAETSAALSPGVSVQRGSSTQTTALSSPVAILYGSTSEQTSAFAAVSATTGPHIQGLTPASLARGTTTTVTITVVGLTGATALRFINASGNVNTSIAASNITVSQDGTSLTATITVSAGSILGTHVVVISTPNGDSVVVDLGTNTINVTQ
jgi:YD repeat-containing protein